MSNARSSANGLMEAMKKLNSQWERTRTDWRDDKAIEFHQRYVEPLPGMVARCLGALEELDTLLKKVRNDCE